MMVLAALFNRVLSKTFSFVIALNAKMIHVWIHELIFCKYIGGLLLASCYRIAAGLLPIATLHKHFNLVPSPPSFHQESQYELEQLTKELRQVNLQQFIQQTGTKVTVLPVEPGDEDSSNTTGDKGICFTDNISKAPYQNQIVCGSE